MKVARKIAPSQHRTDLSEVSARLMPRRKSFLYQVRRAVPI
jgi:hypothetical protein